MSQKIEPKDCKLVGFLSNYEVFSFFKEKKQEETSRNQKQAQKPKRNTHLNTVSYEVIQYLQNTPCAVQTKDSVTMFMELVQPFKLTRSEKLAILNTRPNKDVEIQVIVEESEERLSEEQMRDLIDIINKTLPPLPSEEEEEEGVDDMSS